MPTVSIVIVSYNSRRYIDTCIQSLQQNLPRDVEIIVLDNASIDGSAAYLADHYPSVKLISNPINIGFAAGNNRACEDIRGEFIVFINPDTRVTSGWLEPLINTMQSDPQVGLATPKILLMSDPNLINTCGNSVHLTGLTLCRGINQPSETREFAQTSEINAISGAGFVIRRTLFEHLGGFDELMFTYMEDTDLSLRAQQMGYKCVYVPNSVIYHDYLLRFGPLKTFYQERNRYIMLLKLFRWQTLLLMLPLLLLSELVTWGFILTRDRRRLSNKPRAYIAILRLWRLIMAQRRKTQALRQVSDRALLKSLAYRMEFEQTGRDTVSFLSHLIFDPLFWLSRQFLLLLVRW
jgi:hypothetical protein